MNAKRETCVGYQLYAIVRLMLSRYAERLYPAWGLAWQRFSNILLGQMWGHVFVILLVGNFGLTFTW